MDANEASPQLTASKTELDQKVSAAPDATTTTQSGALGLALSGGGVRAALFSLGVVIGLIETGCHRRVRCVASVSGGSILNAALAHADRLTGFSSLPQFESLASNLAASLASREGVFAYNWRAVVYGLWWLVRNILYASLVWGFAAGVLAALIQNGMPVFPHVSEWPWQVIGPVAAVSVLVLLYLSRGRFQEAMYTSVLKLAAGIRFGPLFLSDWDKVGRDWKKAGKGTDVMHVLVATDLLSGEPMYFSSKFVHCRPYGWSTPDGIHTAEAVYSSAAFPGVFPPKRLRTSRLKFQNGEMPGPLPPIVKLVDGGVYNNLGNDWFEILNQQSQASPPLWPFGELKLEPKPSMIDAKNVIIVNASAPSRSLRRPTFLTLARIMSVLYDNTVRPRVTTIRNHDLPLIDIAETPFKLADRLAELKDDVGCRAKASLKKLEGKTDEFWADFTRDTAGTPTKLSGAGRRTAARLMLHGYLASVVLFHAKFGGNLPEQILGEEYFLKLVDKELPLERPARAKAPTPAPQETEKPAAQNAAIHA